MVAGLDDANDWLTGWLQILAKAEKSDKHEAHLNQLFEPRRAMRNKERRADGAW